MPATPIPVRLARLGWRRSRKGNLWKTDGGWCLTVFRRRDGRFGWSVTAGDDGPTSWSPESYRTEAEAAQAATDWTAE